MAALCCLLMLAFLKTALCIEHANTSESINITLKDTSDTFSDREDSLNFTELEITPTPSSFPDSAARTSEAVTVFSDQPESTDTSIPNTTPDVPRAALPLPVSGVLPTPVTEGKQLAGHLYKQKCWLFIRLCVKFMFSSVVKLCPCNLQTGQCDVNCCCDPDCTEEVSLFTDCSIKTIR